MAAAWAIEETEDLVTCSVCFTEFDEVSHRPKFLTCFHTICLQCLTKMFKERRVTCPLCRQETTCPSTGPSGLANNPYVLHVARMHLTGALLQLTEDSEWCLICGSASVSAECSAAGHWLIMGNSREAQRLQKRRDATKMKFALAIEKRQELRNYLLHVEKDLNSVLDNVQKEIEDNDLQLAQLTSMLEDEGGHGGHESLTSARQLIDLAAQEADESLERIGQSMDQHETENRLQIKIEIRNSQGHKVPTCNLLESGFRRDSSRQPKKFISERNLISHLVFSILRRQSAADSDSPVKCTPPTAYPVPVGHFSSIEPAQPVQPDNEPCSTDDVLAPIPRTPVKSILLIKFQNGGKSIGHLRIQPSVEFLEGFMNRFQQSATYENCILKGKIGSFLTLGMYTEPAIKAPSRWASREIRAASEVGICEEMLDDNGDVLYWNWVFLLKDFDRREVKPSYHFGHVVEGSEVINYLTGIGRNHRPNVKFTVKTA